MLFSKFVNTSAFEKLIHFLNQNEYLIDLKPFLLKTKNRFSVSDARLIGIAVYGQSCKKYRCIKLAEMIKSNVQYIAFEMACKYCGIVGGNEFQRYDNEMITRL